MKKPLRAWLRQSLMTGLLVLLPVYITVWILLTIVGWADRVMYSAMDAVIPVLNPQNYIQFNLPITGTEINGIPGLGVVLLALILISIGLLTRLFVVRYIFRWFNRLMKRIPLASSIYFGLRQILKSITDPQAEHFRRAVYIEYPRKGIYSMAFVTGTANHLNAKGIEERVLSLFVPTTPNPTSGFYLMIPESQTIRTDLTVEEAFKMIVSAGVLVPGKDEASSEEI